MSSKKDIIKKIEYLGRSYGVHQVFDDLMQMGVCALALETFEIEYFNRIKRYSKTDLNQFPALFGDIIMLFKKELSSNLWTDFLGDILEEIGCTNQRNGQFLTPINLCKLMAMVQGDFDGKSVLDCAVGTGRTLLASLSNGKGAPSYVEGVDIDLRACNISALNLCFHGLKGRIIWGDALNLKTYRVYEINIDPNIPIKVVNDSEYLEKQQIAINNSKNNTILPTMSYGDLFS
ncbi:MAG: N-6 DNA methylase [Flavobacteriales bacterium]|jgi:type I restriction enzyme M protein